MQIKFGKLYKRKSDRPISSEIATVIPMRSFKMCTSSVYGTAEDAIVCLMGSGKTINFLKEDFLNVYELMEG